MAKKSKQSQKIVRYRKPVFVNAGNLIFILLFIYLVVYVYSYVTREKIRFYEVTEGTIVDDKSYTGLILRHETTENAEASGYINYYIREGKRASVGTNVYSVDETGTLATLLAESGAATLTQENLAEIRRQLNTFVLSYSDMKFQSVYDAHFALDAAVLEYVNFNSLDNQEHVISQLGVNFKQIKTPQSGVISYAIDGKEDLTAEAVTEKDFDRTNYSRAITRAGQLVGEGTPVYKVITDDQWSLIFPITEGDQKEFAEKKSLRVTFPGHNLTTSGKFSMYTGGDGTTFGKLDFSKYMVQFESDRYAEFEIATNTSKGLKIPISSVVTKNFYAIPSGYLTKGGESKSDGFYKEVYTENGTQIEFVPASLFYVTEDYCYINTDSENLKNGDYIVMPDSQSRFQIGMQESLMGVYNINKGYTVFKHVEIQSENDEYYIVVKNQKYGLSVYDHIVMDASLVGAEGELIYQ